MGCDIHCYAERKTPTGQEVVPDLAPFDWRSYGMYGFLADVRNYSDVPPIAQPRGIPSDASQSVRDEYESWNGDAHSASWLSIAELTNFDYDQSMENRRVMRDRNGGCTCEPGEGKKMTFLEFLGESFFKDLDRLKSAGADRVIFWFDN